MFSKLFGGKPKKKADPGVRLARKGQSQGPQIPLVPPIPVDDAPTGRDPVGREPEPSPAETRALLQQALASAEMELDQRKERDRRDPAGAVQREDKRSLITAAMAIHRIKQKSFQDLDPQTRAKLRSFAENAMGVNKLPKK